jgi:hypothetical protein
VPKDTIFLDQNRGSIAPGAPFPESIETALGEVDATIVLIGRRWRGERGFLQSPRLSQRNDWIRREVELALAANHFVLPVRIGGVAMPKRSEVPDSLRAFAALEAVTVRIKDVEFGQDMVYVATELGKHLPTLQWQDDRFIYLIGSRLQYLAAIERRYHSLSLPVAGDAALPLTKVFQPLQLVGDPQLPSEQQINERQLFPDEREPLHARERREHSEGQVAREQVRKERAQAAMATMRSARARLA